MQHVERLLQTALLAQLFYKTLMDAMIGTANRFLELKSA